MKSKTLSKILSFTVVTAVTVSMLSGCGKKNTNTNAQSDNKPQTVSADEPGWEKNTSPITLDWYMNFSWFQGKWGQDEISKYIAEKTGVNVNFIVPAGNENEKLNTMIASGKLPDILTLDWYDDGIKKLLEGDLLQPLNKLAEQYDPYFFKIASKQTLDWYAQPDGNVYGYPNFSTSPDDYKEIKDLTSNQMFLVKKDMYEALGNPDMTTPEGFLNALKAAKEKFPTVNGQPLIPLGAKEFSDGGNDSFEGYLQNLLAIPNEKDGKLYDRNTDPEYTRWLKTFRKANELGLMSKDIFTDKRSQIEEKVGQGRYFAMLYQMSDMGTPQQALFDKDPNSVYIAVDGPMNSKKDTPKLGGPSISGWTLTLISKSCKDPQRAIQFMTYLMSEEGQHDMYFGKKGVHWDTVNGKDQYLPEVQKVFDASKDNFNKQYGGVDIYWMLANDNILKPWKPENKAPFKQPYDWTIGKVVSYAQYNDINPPSSSKEGIVQKKVSAKWGTLLPKMILAKSDEDIDKYISEYEAEKQKQGYDQVVNYQQQKVDENKKKLGIK